MLADLDATPGPVLTTGRCWRTWTRRPARRSPRADADGLAATVDVEGGDVLTMILPGVQARPVLTTGRCWRTWTRRPARRSPRADVEGGDVLTMILPGVQARPALTTGRCWRTWTRRPARRSPRADAGGPGRDARPGAHHGPMLTAWLPRSMSRAAGKTVSPKLYPLTRKREKQSDFGRFRAENGQVVSVLSASGYVVNALCDATYERCSYRVRFPAPPVVEILSV